MSNSSTLLPNRGGDIVQSAAMSMEETKTEELKVIIEECKKNPKILHHPSLLFFKTYLQSVGAHIPPAPKVETDNVNFKRTDTSSDDILDEEIVESDVELDDTGVVEPDNDEPQQMGDPSVEVTGENQEFAQNSKSKAMDAISEGNLDEAISYLTEAIISNPFSAILYAARAIVYLKLKKPNAAIRDANAALQINPDSAKGYKSRGLAKAMLGLWEEAASDLHVAAKLDYDDEIGLALKSVEPNAQKIEEHRRKYDRLRKAKELKMNEREKQRKKDEMQAEAASALKDGQIIGIHSSKELEKKLNAASKMSRLVILYFTATWCGPCRFISPVYTSLASKYTRVAFLKADIDEAKDVAAKWNISSVPTFFFIKNHKVVDKVVGADKNSLESKISEHSN